MRAAAPPGPRRIFVGKNAERAATVSLADADGKPRLTLTVDAAGNPRVPVGTINLLTVDPTRLGMDTEFLPQLLALQPAPNNYDIGDGLNTAGYRFTSPQKRLR